MTTFDDASKRTPAPGQRGSRDKLRFGSGAYGRPSGRMEELVEVERKKVHKRDPFRIAMFLVIAMVIAAGMAAIVGVLMPTDVVSDVTVAEVAPVEDPIEDGRSVGGVEVRKGIASGRGAGVTTADKKPNDVPDGSAD